MDSSQRLLVFHRNGIFRDCLASYLSHDRGYEAKSVNHDQSDEVANWLADTSDIVLLDLGLPNDLAIEITRAVKDAGMKARVLILASHDQHRLVECIAAGAHGCVLENSTLEHLDEAISQVLRGETFCSPELVASMFSELARFERFAAKQVSVPKERSLTSREHEVLELLSARKSNKEIAAELCVSLFTVKNHVHNILEKLKVYSRAEAVDVARQQYKMRTAADAFFKPER